MNDRGGCIKGIQFIIVLFILLTGCIPHVRTIAYQEEQLTFVNNAVNARLVHRFHIQNTLGYKEFLFVDSGPWTAPYATLLFVKHDTLTAYSITQGTEKPLYVYKDNESSCCVATWKYNNTIIVRPTHGKLFLVFDRHYNLIKKIRGETDNAFFYNGYIIDFLPHKIKVIDSSTGQTLWKVEHCVFCKSQWKYVVGMKGVLTGLLPYTDDLIAWGTEYSFRGKPGATTIIKTALPTGKPVYWNIKIASPVLLSYSHLTDHKYLVLSGTMPAGGSGLSGQVSVIDTEKGKVVCHKEGRLFPYLEGQDHETPYFWIWEQSYPDVISKINIPTCKKISTVSTPHIFPSLDIDENRDLLLYAEKISGTNTYRIVETDKKTGERLWETDTVTGHYVPLIMDDFFIFPSLNESGLWPYYSPTSVSFGKFTSLTDKAFVFDLKKKRMLWEATLHGNVYSKITNMVVIGNYAFIRSLNGWLYEIAWDNHKNAAVR